MMAHECKNKKAAMIPITMRSLLSLFALLVFNLHSEPLVGAFTLPSPSCFSKLCSSSLSTYSAQSSGRRQQTARCRDASLAFLRLSNKDDGVIELEDDTEPKAVEVKEEPKGGFSAPFLSQGEIDQEALNPDLSDPKQARVIIYIIISLLPVLFLIPLMLGSRDLIPLDELPPVQM